MDKTQKLKYGLKQTREFQIKLDRLQLESKCKSFNFQSIVSFHALFPANGQLTVCWDCGRYIEGLPAVVANFSAHHKCIKLSQDEMAKSLFECKRILNVKAASLGLLLVTAPPPPPPLPAPAQMNAVSIKSKCQKRKYACAPTESSDAENFLKGHASVIDELETVLKYGKP